MIVAVTAAGREEIEDKRERALGDVARLLEFLGPQDAEALLRIQKKVVKRYGDGQ